MNSFELLSDRKLATGIIVVGMGGAALGLSGCKTGPVNCPGGGKGWDRGGHCQLDMGGGGNKASSTPKAGGRKAPQAIVGSLIESLVHNGHYAPVQPHGKSGATSEVGSCGTITFTRSGAFKDSGNPGWNAFYHGKNEGHNITLDGLKQKLPCAQSAAMPGAGETPQLVATVWRDGEFMPDAAPATEQVGALALDAALPRTV